MKRWIKILIAVIATPIVIIIIFASAYLIMNLQGVIEPYQVGNPDAECKILITSQGSKFKDKLLEDLVYQLKSDTVYMSILDCTSLDEEKVTDWDVILIIHTTQIHGMPEAAKNYLERVSDLSKVVLVTTSGGGDEAVTEFGVDAISTASRLASIDKVAGWTISKVQNILVAGIHK